MTDERSLFEDWDIKATELWLRLMGDALDDWTPTTPELLLTLADWLVLNFSAAWMDATNFPDSDYEDPAADEQGDTASDRAKAMRDHNTVALEKGIKMAVSYLRQHWNRERYPLPEAENPPTQ